jgi:hypothetical protein
MVCLDHRLWLGDLNYYERAQIKLDHRPDILDANRLHRDLVKTYGIEAATDATDDALDIVTDWTRWSWEHHWGDRLRDLGVQPGEGIRSDDPRYEAASYPEIVAVTAVLASPEWRCLALSEHPERDFPRFIDEIGRRLGVRSIEHDGIGHPVRQWIARQREQARYERLVDTSKT